MTDRSLPRLARWLLARAVPHEWRDSIEGDLEEERARRRGRGLSTGPVWAVALPRAWRSRLTVGTVRHGRRTAPRR